MLSMLKYISIVQKPLILSKFRTLEGLKNDNSGQFINLNELSKLIKKIKKCFDTMKELEELKKNKFQLTQFSIMLDWLKNINKEHPEFWKNYVSKFDKKSTRFVVLSTETSGMNVEKDVILSIGSFAVIDNSIVIGDSFEAVLIQIPP
jgi:hypothetical protein